MSIFDVLLEVAGPIIQRDELLAKIDFTILEKIGVEFESSDLTYFATEETLQELLNKQKNTHVKETEKQLSAYGSSTKIFFYFLEAISKLLIPILKLAENISNQLQRIEKELAKIPENDFRKAHMRKYHENLKNEFFMYRICMDDDERITLVNQFYSKFFGLLLSKMPDNLCIPAHYITDYIEFQTFFGNIKKNYFKQFGVANFKLYLTFLDLIISDKYKTANKYTKAKYLDLLFTFNIMEKGNIVGVLKDHLESHENIRRFLQSILKFYSEIEFMTDVQGVSQMKHRYRFFISKFLLKALKMKEYEAAFLDLTKSEEVSNYVGHLVTDLNYFLDEAFEKLKKISQNKTSEDNNNINRVTTR